MSGLIMGVSVWYFILALVFFIVAYVLIRLLSERH